MNQTLEGHNGSVMVVCWNPCHKKLTTSDQNGLIIVWILHKGMWYEEMINNRNKSVVRDMKWTSDGQKICIIYEDGAVIVGSVDGNRLWGRDLPLQLCLVEWSPDSRMILFCTLQGECHLYDPNGTAIGRMALFGSEGGRQCDIVGIEWHKRGGDSEDPTGAPSLAVAFLHGLLQLMRSDTDERPVLVDTGLAIRRIQWNAAGSVLAVSGHGVREHDSPVVAFYSPAGQLVRAGPRPP